MKRVEQRAASAVPPVLTVALVVLWLLLNQTSALGEIALGVVLALALVYGSATLRPLQPRLRRPYVVVGLLLVVLKDIVQSNFGVARIVLGLVGKRKVRSGFVTIPLDLRDPHGLAALAAIVTLTPGTVWVDLAADGSALTLHVLDLEDEQEWIDRIKDRYERRLRLIFE